MGYYVLGDQGQKYGPADVATLNNWAAEGRLLPSTMLEDETSGQQVAASSVAGVTFAPPMATSNYPRPGVPTAPTTAAPQFTRVDASDEESQKAGIIAIVAGLASFGFTATIGILGLFCFLTGMGSAWRAKDGKPALGYIGLAINIAAAAFWAYVRFGPRR